MTELRERLLTAERDGGAGAAIGAAKPDVLRAVGRKHARRVAGIAGAATVAVLMIATATVAVLDGRQPVQPAHPTVQPEVANATSMTRVEPGAAPSTPASRRMWDLMDDSWVLALWGTSSNPEADHSVRSFDLVVVSPDGVASNTRPILANATPQLLAWSPVFKTALISTAQVGESPVAEDAQLAVIQLDGGEDSWTPECLDSERAGGESVRPAAAPVDGGYAVRNSCGAEFFMGADGVRTELTALQQKALLAAIYPGMHLTSVAITATEAVLHWESVSTSLDFDSAGCSLLIRPREDLLGTGCPEPNAFVLNAEGESNIITPLPGVDSAPRIAALCGTGAVYGTLSNGSDGVGVVEGQYALPFAPSGTRATSCRDGKFTWYIAGGDLYVGATDRSLTRLVDLDASSAENVGGLGVLSVAPTLLIEPLG